MIPLASSELARLVDFLAKYDIKSTVSQLAGLLTAPTLQANTVRVEVLVHLAVAHCRGKRKAGLSEIHNWLNEHLTGIARQEDPVEDVFITNVETPEGNRRVFQGIWGSNDYFIQAVLDTLGSVEVLQKYTDLREPVFALLRLSDCIAKRLGLQRWHSDASMPQGTVPITSAIRLGDRVRAVTFTQDDLESLGASREVLAPFILTDEDRENLLGESTEHSSLERYPLIEFGDELVFTLPHAVSPAILRFVLSELRQMGCLQAFGNALSTHQARQVEEDGLGELKGEVESLTSPKPDSQTPSLHSWLLKLDIDKYLHVVLLHGKLDWLEGQGMHSIMQYPEAYCIGLGKYLSKVSKHCQTLPDFAEGMTLLVAGGLWQGGYMLDLKEWPDQWRVSFIQVSDLLMLASEPERSVTRYLKCIKQKEWMEKEGVNFLNINGDYSFYCFWRCGDYRLVPRDCPVDDVDLISIGTDEVLLARQEIRNLMDRHTIQTTNDVWLSVMRFSSDTYFKSMQGRPIYASPSYFRVMGVLAGAVETPRGPSWLLTTPSENSKHTRHLLCRIWSSFLGLCDKLVFEVEALYPEAPLGAVEIRVNFDQLVVPEDHAEFQPSGVTIGEPVVVVNLGQRTAEIKFPPDFLMHFRQPENTGERLVLRAIANGLVRLHRGVTERVDETVLDELMNKVIGNLGARVLHLHTYSPIEHLLLRKSQKQIFLTREDVAFSKIRLSEGCTATCHGTNIKSKLECNAFLHRVVDKIWKQIREQLRQLDRVSVICKVLEVHEAVTQDRNHWRRTAQAILALYYPEEDVIAVAQKRESERSNVSLSARTILEMAICECPTMGGRQLSRWKLDELLAKVALLLEVATDSDAVNGDLIKQPRIDLHPNGEYTIDRDFHNTVIKPFWSNYFQGEFEEAAEEYTSLYQDTLPPNKARVDKIFSSDFMHAFQVEFDLTPDEVVEGLKKLVDLAVERSSVVVQTTLGDLKARLTAVEGLSSGASEAFIRTFSIFHRSAWDQPPSGFKCKDIYPWRFRRRLSAMARPIFVFGEQDDDTVLFGAGLLQLGIVYLLDKSEQGHLPSEFFRSDKMKQYTGAVNNKKGREFSQKVAHQLSQKSQNEWKTCVEVQMTKLGASDRLGDVDVLAWRSTGEIKIIECKHLQFARTVADVAEICRRFRGEAKDELDKHVQRVNWIKANPASLQDIVGFVPDADHIDDRLVTNTHVPIMYLESLPVRVEKIGPLEKV